METEYQKIIDYMLESGKRIKEKAGKIADIGIKKQYLTEEDIAIERGFSEIIKTFGAGDHAVFAEEENFDFQETENIWAIDPISSTSAFIGGLPHYAIVCSHLHKNEAVFAAVYDPSVDELFTAIKGNGAFLNEQRINIGSRGNKRILFNLSLLWQEEEKAKAIWIDKYESNIYRTSNSFAVNYCWVAAGRYDGIIALTKDSFPEFAGKLIIEEAGGIFTNKNRDKNINHADREFVGGSKEIVEELISVIQG